MTWTHPGSVGELRTQHSLKRPRNNNNSHAKKKAVSGPSVRCVVWQDTHTYTLVRKGDKIFSNEIAISECFKGEKMNENMLYIFRHNDPDVYRYGKTPVYEACLKCGTYYIKAQKCHLKQAYSNSGRTDIECKDKILDDGTPYWVDRYVEGKVRARESKRRYDEKNKKRW